MASLQSSLESMKASEKSLNAELGTDLLATLSVEDQREVDRLNDEIQELTSKNRSALEERVKVGRSVGSSPCRVPRLISVFCYGQSRSAGHGFRFVY